MFTPRVCSSMATSRVSSRLLHVAAVARPQQKRAAAAVNVVARRGFASDDVVWSTRVPMNQFDLLNVHSNVSLVFFSLFLLLLLLQCILHLNLFRPLIEFIPLYLHHHL